MKQKPLAKDELLALLKTTSPASASLTGTESPAKWQRVGSVYPELRLAIAVCYWHGLRVSELINLTRDHLQDGYLVLQRLKGSRKTAQRFVRHDNQLLDECAGLTELVRIRKPGEKLFPSLRTRFRFYYLIKKVYGRRADIAAPKLGTHVFKRSIAMHTKDTLHIKEMQEHLGHKSIGNTGHYYDADQDEVSEKIATALGATVK